MDVLANNALLIVLGGILAAILFFIIFKGAIRMIVLATAIILAVAAWIFLQRNGFTYLSFVTDSPQPWMVQVLAWGWGFLSCCSSSTSSRGLRSSSPGSDD